MLIFRGAAFQRRGGEAKNGSLCNWKSVDSTIASVVRAVTGIDDPGHIVKPFRVSFRGSERGNALNPAFTEYCELRFV